MTTLADLTGTHRYQPIRVATPDAVITGRLDAVDHREPDYLEERRLCDSPDDPPVQRVPIGPPTTALTIGGWSAVLPSDTPCEVAR